MADEAPGSAQSKERERQTAVAPLNTIGLEDIGAGKAKINAWLLRISDKRVDLNTLLTIAGGIPVIGNIMALIDAVWDIVDMITKKLYADVLQWVSLAINLLGVIPFPPATGAARMSLRPMLHLLRQEIAKTAVNAAKHVVPNIGEAFVNVLITHLNDTIAGTLDKFVAEAEGYLSGFLQDCAKKVDEIVDGVIGALKIALGEKPLFSKTGAEKHPYDPETQSTMSRVLEWGSGVVTDTANLAVATAAEYGVPDFVKAKIHDVIASLVDLKTLARDQIMRLADAGLQYGIAWMIVILKQALLKRKGKVAVNVAANKGAEASKHNPGGELGHISLQPGATNSGNCCKQGGPGTTRPAGRSRGKTPHAISFATGSESFTHTDFELAATLPIAWHRTYDSHLAAYDQSNLGARWLSPFNTRIDVTTATKGKRSGQRSFIFHGADGRSHAYPVLAIGSSHRDPIEEITLTRVSQTLLVLDFGKPMPAGGASDWRETYELVDTVASKVRIQGKQHFRLIAQQTRTGAAIGLRYDHVVASGEQVLSDIVSRQDDVILAHVGTRPHTQSGLIESLWEIKEGQVIRQLAAYTHDENGDLIAAQDENGASWNYSYSHHLVTRYTDRTGRGINLEYDGTDPQAKAVREWADDGTFATTLEWDKNIRLTYVTDALGQETWYYYDILGYTYRIIHPDKREEWFYRDEAKNVTRHIHPDGSTDDYRYDANGNLQTHIRTDGSQVHFEYDALNHATGWRDAEGGVWRRALNVQGLITEEIDPLGHKTEYAYDEAGRPIKIIDAKGGVKALAYTPTGQVTSYTDCSGKTSRWAYDERGRLIRATDAAGHITLYRYTELSHATLAAAQGGANHPGQLEEVTLPDRSREHFVYDAEGRLLAHTDALARRSRYDYTRSGLVAGRTDAAGQRLQYQWDLLGRLTQLRNENGSRYTLDYDPVGKLLSETGFDGKSTEYRYEETTGTLAEVVDGGVITQYEFDPLGRLSERRANGQVESFVYDQNGLLVEARNEDAKLQRFHDAAGNLTREHQHDLASRQTAIWRHGYDELNQRVATIRPDGHSIQWLSYGSGHLHGLLVDGQDILGFERDDLHQEILREQGNGLAQSQSHDAMGRLLEQRISRTQLPPGANAGVSAGTLNVLRGYAYDAAGQLVGIHDSRRGNLSYRYDPVGRLLEAHSRLGRETFAFDPAGNIGGATQPGAQPDGLATNRITTRVAVRLDHQGRNLAGRLMDNLLKNYAGVHYKWDARGNLVEHTKNGKKTSFTWDAFGRMRSARTDDQITTFRYDPLGRRIGKENDSSQILFGWDGDTLAYESSSLGEGWARGQTVHYVHERDSFVPLVQIRRPGSMRLTPTTDVKALTADNGGRYDIELDPLWNEGLREEEPPRPFAKEEIAFYQCDHLGTPQELTDHEGSIAWSASYRAWGEAKEAISEAGRKAGFRNPIRFQGQYFDEETGLHYNRHRYYDPGSGRFVSRDPIKLAGGVNLHAYAPNPIEWIDPLGLSKKKERCQTRKNSTEPALPEKVIASDGNLRLEHYVRSGDHAPAHFHLRGEGGLNIPVGQNGNPLDSKTKLTAAQQAFIDGNKSKLRSSVDRIQRWHRYQNLPNDCNCCD
ncbi:RHS family protein [Variovorax paradoxus B4]|uniref:RHS family protein n=1 Tax=Variovorax paradoxus B4 TaxID=1246301 RepID=T1XIR3_VARPD|nr:RHS repeat-associated core domain-containing protein [Variovorax paradoxus]AGU52777.1 RHS family protein [Variovorax paradoxus B4]